MTCLVGSVENGDQRGGVKVKLKKQMNENGGILLFLFVFMAGVIFQRWVVLC